MKRLILILIVLAVAGCGHERREQTLSTLNVEADKWLGGKDFTTTAADAYGNPITAKVDKGTFNYNLQLRSNGPDGLPQNHDDIVVSRSKSHGEGSVTGAVVEDIKRGLKPKDDKKP